MRLSTLEKRILLALDNGNVNSFEEHLESGEGFKCREVFFKVYDVWPEGGDEFRKAYKARKVAFSRAVHRLVEEKGLVAGLALAWVWVEKGCHHDLTQWQGGGARKAVRGHGTDTPRFKKLALTEKGWEMVQQWRAERRQTECGTGR